MFANETVPQNHSLWSLVTDALKRTAPAQAGREGQESWNVSQRNLYYLRAGREKRISFSISFL